MEEKRLERFSTPNNSAIDVAQLLDFSAHGMHYVLGYGVRTWPAQIDKWMKWTQSEQNKNPIERFPSCEEIMLNVIHQC